MMYVVIIGVETFTFRDENTAVRFAEIAEAHKDGDVMIGMFFGVGDGDSKIHDTAESSNEKK